MNIQSTNKLTGIPKIIYFSKDQKSSNTKVMLDNFEKWEIKNYERVVIPSVNSKKWKKNIVNENLSLTDEQLLYNYTYVKTIIDWYDNSEDEYCIFMSDNTNIDLAQYWTFDWEFLMNALPYNWDCIQLGISDNDTIIMHLKPKGNGIIKTFCFMITRQFAKKIKNLHYNDGKYTLHVNTADFGVQEYYYGDINYFLFELGITYTFPVFNTWGEYSDDEEEKSSINVERWWKNESKKFTVFDKFHYYKKNDPKMKVFLNSDDEYKNNISKKIMNIKLVSDGQMILWI